MPYYLKIDIEGHDSLCVDQLDPADTPKYISFETGGRATLQRLQELGYTHFKCVSQYCFLPLELPPIPEEIEYERLGRLMVDRNILLRVARRCGAWRLILRRMNRIRGEVEKYRMVNGWSFSGESSGPFGEETPGRWQSFDEICKTYQYYQNLMNQGKPSLFWTGADGSFWTDFHAQSGG